MTEFATEWRAAGACLTTDPDLFFPIGAEGAATGQVAAAQRICARCPVRAQCLEFAVRAGETHGIWGGTTPEERVGEIRRRAPHRRSRGARQSPARSTRPARSE